MTTSRMPFTALITLVILTGDLTAQLPIPAAENGPTNHAVLLPPQALDGPGKTANTTRERHGQWSISAGVYFMQPVFETNPAFLVRAGGGNLARQVDFDHGLQIAPNVWLGFVSERGWGVRGRWFQFDHGAGASYVTNPGETVIGISALTLGQAPIAGAVSANSNLAINVGDFQGTWSRETAAWTHLLGFGVRYTHLSQGYRATIVNTGTVIDLNSAHNLNAFGPSFSLQTKRRCGETGFAVYGQLHGAILFGQADEAYTALNNGVLQQFSRGQTDVLPAGEMEVGGEYQRSIGRVNLFLQAGFVGQVWWGGGNASNLDPLGPASATNHNFGFLGLALRAGVRY